MNASSVALDPSPAAGRRPLAATILGAWPLVAAWDFVCASVLSILAYHSTFALLWQGVASTVLGPRALKMGATGVAVGLALHVAVALVWTTVFAVALSASAALRRLVARPGGALAVACAYGPVIWLVMSLGVIPLATGRPPTIGARWWVQVVAHVPFVALPLVFAVRRLLLAPRATP